MGERNPLGDWRGVDDLNCSWQPPDTMMRRLATPIRGDVTYARAKSAGPPTNMRSPPAVLSQEDYTPERIEGEW